MTRPRVNLIAAAFAATFCAMITAPLVIHAAGLASDTRYIDNRLPMTLPKPPADAAGLLPFARAFTAYLRDNFGLRSELIVLNHQLRKSVGVSGVPALMIGKQGWQFLSTANNITEQHRGVDRFTPLELDRWIDAMEALRDWLAERSIPLVIAVAPNQQTIYGEYLPFYVNRVHPVTRFDQIERRLRERGSTLEFVNMKHALLQKKAAGKLYNAAESHWNSLGAFYGFQEVLDGLKRQGVDLPRDSLDDFSVRIETKAMLPATFSEVGPHLHRKQQRAFDAIPEKVYKLSNLRVAEIAGDASRQHTAYFISDSFTQEWRKFMPSSFRTAYVSTNIDEAYPVAALEQLKPSVVVYEIVERYLSWSGFLDASNIPPKAAMPLSRMDSLLLAAHGGFIDGISTSGDTVTFHGWAIDPRYKQPPRHIFFYAGDTAATFTRPTLNRPDVAIGFVDQRIGFRLSVPRAALADLSQEVNIVARLSDGHYVKLAIDKPQQVRLEQIRTSAN